MIVERDSPSRRIDVTSGSQVRFFVQQLGEVEVDLGTENTADTIPENDDCFAPFAEIIRVAGVGTLSLDWWEVQGDR